MTGGEGEGAGLGVGGEAFWDGGEGEEEFGEELGEEDEGEVEEGRAGEEEEDWSGSALSFSPRFDTENDEKKKREKRKQKRAGQGRGVRVRNLWRSWRKNLRYPNIYVHYHVDHVHFDFRIARLHGRDARQGQTLSRLR